MDMEITKAININKKGMCLYVTIWVVKGSMDVHFVSLLRSSRTPKCSCDKKVRKSLWNRQKTGEN